MASNQGEGIGDDFFEQILSVPSSYSTGTGDDSGGYAANDSSLAAATPAMAALQLGSGGGNGGGGFREIVLPPLGLNLEHHHHQDGSTTANGPSSSSSTGINHEQESVNLTSLFPPFGPFPTQSLRPPAPSPSQLHQPFHGLPTTRAVATAPQPPALRPRVRARRGQATDPHSIAERLRRERITERVKALQDLVPSCNKTDRAAMLDEIVDYVKFLRLQVKVLSMSRLGGTHAVSQLVSDVPLSSVEVSKLENFWDVFTCVIFLCISSGILFMHQMSLM
ncbi:unnamed protein product [Ilex paraguariensis]|uniref:BHLH domain-containing protein n=1 Tax=Ilex paraguariensis TaxID=185542 RepID=A0ABC8R056_9AQUA